jgi:hypothetical protein
VTVHTKKRPRATPIETQAAPKALGYSTVSLSLSQAGVSPLQLHGRLTVVSDLDSISAQERNKKSKGSEGEGGCEELEEINIRNREKLRHFRCVIRNRDHYLPIREDSDMWRCLLWVGRGCIWAPRIGTINMVKGY